MLSKAKWVSGYVLVDQTFIVVLSSLFARKSLKTAFALEPALHNITLNLSLQKPRRGKFIEDNIGSTLTLKELNLGGISYPSVVLPPICKKHIVCYSSRLNIARLTFCLLIFVGKDPQDLYLVQL